MGFLISLFADLISLLAGLSLLKSYVVPTGSMAPTLLGYHKSVACPQCNIRFPVNASMEGERIPPRKITGCTCFNCRHAIDFAKEKLSPRLLGGDRILVAALPVQAHERHHMLVHRYPPSWFDDKQTVHYVSRPWGLPGETLAIHGGRVYRSTAPKHKDPDIRPEDLWRGEHMHRDDAQSLKLFEQGKFQIARKSPALLKALRVPVHDHDFPAPQLAKDVGPRWAALKDTAWKTDASHGFHHPGTLNTIDWLGYRHLLFGSAGKPQLITDFLSYNSFQPDSFPSGANWVGDLILECQVTVVKAQGQLWLDLARGGDRFQARIELADGRCTLFRVSKNAKPRELAARPTALNKPGKYRVCFANCEDRLTLWIDNQLPFDDGVAYDPAPQKGPTANDLQPVRIGSLNAAVQVHHLQLWRDLYFSSEPALVDPADIDWSDPEKWGPLRELPVRTWYVQPGHYFFLSDNSPLSSDSRLWGVVPERLLAGKVMLCYSPLHRLGPIR